MNVNIVESENMLNVEVWEMSDREAGHAAVLGVTKSGIQLSD